MKHGDFRIGERFVHTSKAWLCTDVGTRTIVAVCLTLGRRNDWGRGLPKRIQDQAWNNPHRVVVGEGYGEILPEWLSRLSAEERGRRLGEVVFGRLSQRVCVPYPEGIAAPVQRRAKGKS